LLVASAPLTRQALASRSFREKSFDRGQDWQGGLLAAFGAGHRHGIIAREFSAEICADPRTFADARVSVRVPVSALRSDSPEARRAAGLTESGPGAKDVEVMQQKMNSPANLDAAGHPEIRFESAAVQRTSDGLTVRGPLTIRGRALPLVVPLRIQPAGSDYKFTGTFDIKLRDYGITPESVGGVVKVADEVTVVLDIMARARTEECR
jgi:polyisoprenoid-binding protein YceI